MILIYGESQSGKTSKALSLLDKDNRSIYFALDFDKSIDNWKRYNQNMNIDVQYINKYFEYDIEFDIEFRLFQRGAVRKDIKQLVVDPINSLIKRNINSLQDVVDRFKSIEDRYNIQVIIVVNNSFYLQEIKNLKGCQLIETKKVSKKETKSISLVPARINQQFVGLRG